MTDKLWRNILLVFLFLYGPFLIFQSFVDVWPTRQIHAIVEFIGGLTLLLWGARCFIKRPKVVVYGINTFAIAVLIGFCILVPVLVTIALVALWN